MKKKDIQLIIFIGLIFVFAEEAVLSEEPLKERETAEKRQGWGRDPFTFGMSVEGVESRYGDLHLNGIVWDAEVPYAVINNEVVKAGDMLGQIKVIEISKDEVILEEDGERFRLKLEEVEL